ncbi:MAG TPA: hypothetical protein VGL62_11765, partial [Vicinamibacterales bacterium]
MPERIESDYRDAKLRVHFVIAFLTSRSTARRAMLPLAVLVTLYGALLRLDAFTGKYGTLDHPAWARYATHELAPLT